MFKPAPLFAMIVILAVVIAACSPAAVPPTLDPNFINTMVAQTLSAIQIQSPAPIIPVTGEGTATPSPTVTASPTITLTPTPVFTATPLIPQISVSVATNCRVGPGKVYDRVGGLMVGEVTEVFGRNPGGNYWYVRNPDAPGEFCWLWGEYATLSGNLQALPVFTPPPTPTPVPSFDAEYTALESCNNAWWVEFRLVNTGGLTFKSVLLSVNDPSVNTTVSLSDNRFTNVSGCNASEAKAFLVPADKTILSSPVFGYNPAGHALRATITLCSETGVNGTCVTRVLEFKP